jgi:hypothetical protein
MEWKVWFWYSTLLQGRHGPSPIFKSDRMWNCSRNNSFGNKFLALIHVVPFWLTIIRRNDDYLRNANIPIDLRLVEDLLQPAAWCPCIFDRIWFIPLFLTSYCWCILWPVTMFIPTRPMTVFYSCTTTKPSVDSPIAIRRPAQRESTRAAPLAHAKTRVEA